MTGSLLDGFRSIFEDAPGWDDGGTVELCKDGQVTVGDLLIQEGYDGEDEFPDLELIVNGETVSFYDFDGWRKLRA